jgi:anti-sigma factor RsiW
LTGERQNWTEEDLHAYIDGRMDQSRRRAYEAYIEQHPDLVRRIRSYQMQIGEMFRSFGTLRNFKN